jgi:RNA chaperone Hfq
MNEKSIESSLIQKAIVKKLTVVIFTKNGFQMKCVVEAQDEKTLAVTTVDSNKFNLVYKDAISTIQFPVGNLL